MKLKNARVLLTGAAGGIGSAVAEELCKSGAQVLLTDLRQHALDKLASHLASDGAAIETCAADITDESSRTRLIDMARESKINVLINAAGINPFGMLEDQSAREIGLTLQVNTLAPILLCQGMIAVLNESESAHIVNVGSSFGSIGYPGFAAYSATKFAVRGFSEALRRELSDTRIKVHYVSPRATETRLATDRIKAMNTELKVGMDRPEVVARAIVNMLVHESRELHLGFAERLYAKINGLFPGIIDTAVARQLPIIRRYAADTVTAPHSSPHSSPVLNIHNPATEGLK